MCRVERCVSLQKPNEPGCQKVSGEGARDAGKEGLQNTGPGTPGEVRRGQPVLLGCSAEREARRQLMHLSTPESQQWCLFMCCKNLGIDVGSLKTPY